MPDEPFYYQYPEFLCGNVVNALWPAVDLKAEGGYAVALGSIIKGNAYEVACDLPVAPVPDWLAHRIRDHQPHRRKAHPRDDSHPHDQTPDWQAALSQVPQGRQDNALVALAGKLARELPEPLWPTIARTLAGAAAQYPQDPARPYTEADFARISTSACNMERARRHIERPIIFRTVL